MEIVRFVADESLYLIPAPGPGAEREDEEGEEEEGHPPDSKQNQPDIVQ